tara:strand:- start:1610 stop:2713 length:1104 start_codon:yes stop_codon:yes gene_type:complete
MKKNVLFISGSRADYYLLLSLKKELNKNKKINLTFLLTGGATKIKDKKTNKGRNIKKVPLKISNDTQITTPKAISEIVNKLSDYFNKTKYDLVVLLGDRYEILGAAIAAHSFNIKIVHFHGGETTLGSKDDDYRNVITQLSNYHFVTCVKHAQKVKSITNTFSKIFNVGSIGIDSIDKNLLLDKEGIEKELKINLRDNIALVTLHPETKNRIDNQDILNFFSAIKSFPKIDFIFSYPGYDLGYKKIINKILKNKNTNNIHIYKNLGQNLYYSLINISSFVIGNSSSGIIEVPSFKKFTINLGLRQKGRTHAKSVLHSDFNKKKIKSLIKKVMKKKKNKARNIFKNPYQKNGTIKNSAKIINKLLNEK